MWTFVAVLSCCAFSVMRARYFLSHESCLPLRMASDLSNRSRASAADSTLAVATLQWSSRQSATSSSAGASRSPRRRRRGALSVDFQLATPCLGASCHRNGSFGHVIVMSLPALRPSRPAELPIAPRTALRAGSTRLSHSASAALENWPCFSTCCLAAKQAGQRRSLLLNHRPAAASCACLFLPVLNSVCLSSTRQ